ncbi:MAG: Asp-tRNA(Asn)/Glu-tRNA(Gln) amidotransferase subunit GatC [Piscirickettsiaceae bacterium]|nr:Asp-tRNA(Asn)/Glu-tRNA(Gln) amidotransferase subunit GatC [Piscirickettsiaceae bacterium]
MNLDSKDIEKIAHLARLTIDKANIPTYIKNLNNILNLVEKINANDTRDIMPMSHPIDTNQRLREDEISEIDQRENFQTIAPQTKNGVYLVPQVIKLNTP